MEITAQGTAMPKSENKDWNNYYIWWDADTRQILEKAKELYNNAGRKVTRELKEFLRQVKPIFNKGPGNPHERKSWKQFCLELTGGYPCVKTLDKMIDSLDDNLLEPIDDTATVTPSSEEEILHEGNESSGEAASTGKKQQKQTVKFMVVGDYDDGVVITKLRQDPKSEAFFIELRLPEYEGLTFRAVFDAPEEPRPVPQFLLDLDDSTRIWAKYGYPTSMTTFSGWGGVGYVLRERGYKGIGAVEWDPEDSSQNAFQNLARLFPEMHKKNVLLNQDIWKITASELLAIMCVFGLKPGDLDFYQFSPVCTGFSGKNRTKEKLMEPEVVDRDDNVINLYKPAINHIKVLLPKFVLMENVRGLSDQVSFPKLLEIKKALEDAGYYVKWRVLWASDVGAPQLRPRLWMIGVRQDLGIMPSFPDAMRKKVGVRDVLPYVEFFRLEGVVTVTERVLGADGKYKAAVKKFIDKDGKEKSETAPHPIRPSIYPCGTILKSAGVLLKDFGSDEWRTATNEELLKLFTFDPELATGFIGTPEQVRERLGNSVIKLQVDILMDHIEKLAQPLMVQQSFADIA